MWICITGWCCYRREETRSCSSRPSSSWKASLLAGSLAERLCFGARAGVFSPRVDKRSTTNKQNCKRKRRRGPGDEISVAFERNRAPPLVENDECTPLYTRRTKTRNRQSRSVPPHPKENAGVRGRETHTETGVTCRETLPVESHRDELLSVPRRAGSPLDRLYGQGELETR